MNRTSKDFPNENETTHAEMKYPPLEITRFFQAPVERVFNAWSDATLLKEWWGPIGFTCPEAEIDFRVGGRNLIAMKDPSGEIMWSTGEYREIIPGQRIVCTDQFADDDGVAISAAEFGLPGAWPMILLLTLTFKKVGLDQTKMDLKHEGIPPEMVEDCMQGWNESLDKLRRLVERN